MNFIARLDPYQQLLILWGDFDLKLHALKKEESLFNTELFYDLWEAHVVQACNIHV